MPNWLSPVVDGKKKCQACGEWKDPVNDFYFRRATCKPCACKKTSDYQKNNRKSVAEYHRKWEKLNLDKRMEATKLKRMVEPEKFRARDAVKGALKKGILAKEPCWYCGNEKVHAHHYNGYDKENRLTVVWVCPLHHKELHNV